MTGMRLRLLRIKAGLRQADLAPATGCSRAWISTLERKRRVPRAWSDRYLKAVDRLTGRAHVGAAKSLRHE